MVTAEQVRQIRAASSKETDGSKEARVGISPREHFYLYWLSEGLSDEDTAKWVNELDARKFVTSWQAIELVRANHPEREKH